MIHLREDILKSQITYYNGKIAKHKQNVEIYLTYPVGIGEHPDVVDEIVTLVNAITEAEEGKKYIREKLNNEYDRRKTIQRTD